MNNKISESMPKCPLDSIRVRPDATTQPITDMDTRDVKNSEHLYSFILVCVIKFQHHNTRQLRYRCGFNITVVDHCTNGNICGQNTTDITGHQFDSACRLKFRVAEKSHCWHSATVAGHKSINTRTNNTYGNI